MDISQNTIKKIVANNICKSKIDTSLVMFPVRIETRMLCKEVDTYEKPEQIYFVFKRIWEFLEVLENHEDDTNALLIASERVMDKVQELDLVYKADYVFINQIIRDITNCTKIRNISGDVEKKWKEIYNDIECVKPTTDINSSEATRFVNRVEKAYNRANELINGRIPYKGKFREDSHYKPHGGRFGLGPFTYSDTAWMKCYIKHISFCIEVMRELDIKDGTITGLKNAHYLPGGQKDKLRRMLVFALSDNDYKQLEGTPRTMSLINKVVRITAQYKKEVERIIDNKNSLLEAIARFPSKAYRYTYLLAKLVNYRLFVMECVQSSRMKRNDFRRWENIANYTYTPYVEVNRLLKKAISYFEAHMFFKDINLRGDFLKSDQRSQHRTIHFKEKKQCLCIRIYPDVLTINAAIRPLSDMEVIEGYNFLMKWKEECQIEERKVLWESFCNLYTPNRAAWILKTIKPFISAHAQDVDSSVAIEKIISKVCKTNQNEFNLEAVYSELMPDRFSVQATIKTRGEREQILMKYGHRIPKKLQVGFDYDRKIPMTEVFGNSKKNQDHIVLNGNLRWITDYDEAERLGMAVTIPLDQFAFCKRNASGNIRKSYEFSSIYVTGVRSGSATESSELIRRTLTRHLFGENGLDVIDFRTPTNILTEKDEACLDTSRKKLIDLYFDMLEKNTPTNWEKSDAYNLSKVFGIDPEAADNPLRFIAHSDQCNIYQARKRNRIFLKEHSNGGDGEYFEFINRLKHSTYKRYFANNVLPCGVYAPLRIGDQPYGVLPVTDFKNMSISYNHYMHLIKEILLNVSNIWNKLVKKYVIYDGNKENDTNDSQNFLRVLGNSPYSDIYYKRKTVSAPDFLNPIYFRGYQSWNDALIKIFDIIAKHCDNKTTLTPYDFLECIDGLNVPVKDVLLRTEKPNDADILDLFLHRLDAWFIGMLNRHIQRLTNRYKVNIGAFGWVFDAVFKSEEEKQRENEYVLAPSINHAITAAVLRSSFKRNNCIDGKKDYNLSVNLSSVRVRKALRIIKGIRNGLSLGAILGSDLERLIHEDYANGYEMDEFIYWLRQHYPLTPTVTAHGESLHDTPTINVINGLALLEKLRSEVPGYQKKLQLLELYDIYPKTFRESIAEKLKLNNAEMDLLEIQRTQDRYNQKLDRLMYLIAQMEDGYDALTDVVMSESVYKLTEGNREAVDALMNCMDKERNIPLPDVTEIPLNSAHIEQRVLAPMTDDRCDDLYGILGNIEPALEGWLRNMLHHNELRFCFRFKDENEVKTLSDLNLSATELVYLSENKDSFFLFLRYLDWQQHQYVADLPKFLLEEDEGISYADSEFAIDSLKEILITARPIKPDDFMVNYKEDGFDSENIHYDMVNLENKLDQVSSLWEEKLLMPLASLCNDVTVTRSFLTKSVDLALIAFRLGYGEPLLSIHKILCRYKNGLNGDSYDVEEQVKQVRFVINQLNEQIVKHYTSTKQLLDENQNCDTYVDVISKLANHIRIIPKIKYENSNVDYQHLTQIVQKIALQAEKNFKFENVSGSDVENWMMDVAKVRKPIQHLHNLNMYRKCNLWESTFQPVQIKQTSNELGKEWIGIKVHDEKEIVDTKSYLVMDSNASFYSPTHMLQGLLLDFWVERIPYREQTAAVAFHYDQPDAEAPQTILVGLCTSKRFGCWSELQLNRIVRSTIHMVKGRAVEPEHLYADETTSGILPLAGYSGKQNK